VPSLPTLVDMESQLVMHGESANNATALLADCGEVFYYCNNHTLQYKTK